MDARDDATAIDTYWLTEHSRGTALPEPVISVGASPSPGIGGHAPGTGQLTVDVRRPADAARVTPGTVRSALALWTDSGKGSASDIVEEIGGTRSGGALTSQEVERCAATARVEDALMSDGLLPSDAFERVRERLRAGEALEPGAFERTMRDERVRLPHRHLREPPRVAKHAVWHSPLPERVSEEIAAACKGRTIEIVNLEGALASADKTTRMEDLTDGPMRTMSESSKAIVRDVGRRRYLDEAPGSERACTREALLQITGNWKIALGERIERAERCADRLVRETLGIAPADKSRAGAMLAEQGPTPQARRMGRHLEAVCAFARAEQKMAREQTSAKGREQGR